MLDKLGGAIDIFLMAGAAQKSIAHPGLVIVKMVTIMLAAALIVGETYRSWGIGRPILTVADDWFGAAGLLWAARLTTRPGDQGRRIVTAIWGVICGASLSNLAIKLLMPDRMNPGNFSPFALQMLVGAALVISLCVLIAVVLLPVPRAAGATPSERSVQD
jgi:hypothetical protein